MCLCYDALLWPDEVVTLENVWREQCRRAARAHCVRTFVVLCLRWELPREVWEGILACALRAIPRPIAAVYRLRQNADRRWYQAMH